MTTSQSLRIAFTTLGCKVNQSETDLLARQFTSVGYTTVPFDAPADVYVVNTCTVTHVADKKSRQMLGQAFRANPDALVVATGCYASIVGDALASDRTLVIRNRDKDRILQLVEGRLRPIAVDLPLFSDPDKYLDMPGGHQRTRAMVKAQDGCDSHCTYCIIPRARGRSRSTAPEDVVRRTRALADQGHVEVVITGVDLGSYGEDDPCLPDLGGLLEYVLEQTEVPRVRVSSLEPGDFDVSWLSLWQNPRLCRHFHVPLQSGSQTVLERMERKYTPTQFSEMVQACREAIPGVAITTDVMVGFPGETDQEFEDGYRFVQQIQFDGMHVFKYSQRSGTRAARLPGQVPEQLKSERSQILRSESEAGTQRLIQRHGGTHAFVAWEAEREGVKKGMTDTNVRVYGEARTVRGSMTRVRLTSPFLDGLWSEPGHVEIPLVPVS
ncbi:MAG: tRNA (N(6)-L-threonylcarbamoyladenosine(37)-C(2))-methylthiotransferase MtaB [Chloroflexota bacterium]